MVPPKSHLRIFRMSLDSVPGRKSNTVSFSWSQSRRKGKGIKMLMVIVNGIPSFQAYVVNMVNNEKGEPQPELTDPLENAPWAALASLGLFKLLSNDWESQGFSIPMMTHDDPPSAVTNNSPHS